MGYTGCSISAYSFNISESIKDKKKLETKAKTIDQL